MSQKSASTLAPGARVLVRDAEWLVRRVDRASTGGQALTCVGLSELVRDREATFLTDLEALHSPVKSLDPARTRLVADSSNQYQDSLLYLESLLRQTPPTDSRLYTGHQAAMDFVPYQLDPALQVLLLSCGSGKKNIKKDHPDLQTGRKQKRESGIVLNEDKDS